MHSPSRAARWYYGWTIVAAAAVLTLLSTGMRLSIGPFFLPVAQDLGYSRSLLAAIIAAGMLVYGLAMPLAGVLVARHGTRFVLLAGTVLVVASAIGSVAARDPWLFGLCFGVGLSVGLAFTSPVALTPVISHWFTRQRGRALFFLSTGSMAGMALLTPVLTAAIAAWGWQATLLGYAAVFTAVTVPAALYVVRDDAPEHTDLLAHEVAARRASTVPPAQPLPLGQALRTAPFWKVVLGLFACGFSMNLLGTHGMPMLMDHGYDAITSSTGIGLIGVVAIFGTLVLGRIADRVQRRNLLAVIYAVRGLGFFVLLLVGTHWELYLAAAVGGLVWAGSIAMSSALLADVYGVRLVGVLYGLAYVGHQVGGMLSSWLGGWGYERWDTHWVAFGAAGTLLLLAALVALRMPRPGFVLHAPQPAQA